MGIVGARTGNNQSALERNYGHSVTALFPNKPPKRSGMPLVGVSLDVPD